MVEYCSHSKLDSLFHALADSTRRSLLEQVKVGPMRVTELASKYDVSLNAISKHLKVLEKASLIKRNVEGRVHYCEANPEELELAQNWIEHYTSFWSERLDNLEDYLNKKENK